MKIVIFGCQQIAVDFINYIHGLKDVEIALTITYELPLDKTYGYESVLENGRKLGLKVINPGSITQDIVDEIRRINPDVIYSVYYRKIFPKELIDIPKLGCINIHPSLLPKYRGPVPTAWAIAQGEKETGVTIHYMDAGIDTGDILVQKSFPIFDDETGFQLYTRLMKVGAELLRDSLPDILQKRLVGRKQTGTGSYYGKLDGKLEIDWRQKAADIRNAIRVYSKPFNPAETKLFNRYLLINSATVLKDNKHPAQVPGRIIDILEDGRIVVSCADGCLVLDDYEFAPLLSDAEKPIYLKRGNRFG